jgi:glycosyltransferase involved in cell wall biosynthesis
MFKEKINTQVLINESENSLLSKNDNIPFPKISLIIPTLQEEKILDQLSKIYTPEIRKKFNFELIISDGGSTDNTLEIAKKFADKIVEHKESYRQTIAEGRNKGAEIAKGEILVFINADTYPEDFELFFKQILNWSNDKNSKYGAIACAVYGFPDEIKLTDKIFYSVHNNFVKFLNVIKLGMGRGECQIVLKELFKQVNGYNSEIVAGEDFDLFRRISKNTKVKFDPQIIVLESPRRFRKYGYFRTLSYWLLNALTIMFFGKSFSKEWETIR